jgi:hypothetical protein
MAIQALFPDAPIITVEGGRSYLTIGWNEAEPVHAALRRSGCPTTLCLNPETRQARLELWPGVTPERALAVLEVRHAGRRPPAAIAGTVPTSAAPREAAPNPAVSSPISV